MLVRTKLIDFRITVMAQALFFVASLLMYICPPLRRAILCTCMILKVMVQSYFNHSPIVRAMVGVLSAGRRTREFVLHHKAKLAFTFVTHHTIYLAV